MNLNAFFKMFGVKPFDKQTEQIDNAFFVIPDKLRKYVAYGPVHIGLKVGLIRNDNFIPSMDVLQWLAKHSRQKLVLNEDHAWKFICGNNIRMSEITPPKHDVVVVLNNHGEGIGTAEVTRKYLKRMFDIGDLLRRERKKKRF